MLSRRSIVGDVQPRAASWRKLTQTAHISFHFSQGKAMVQMRRYMMVVAFIGISIMLKGKANPLEIAHIPSPAGVEEAPCEAEEEYAKRLHGDFGTKKGTTSVILLTVTMYYVLGKTQTVTKYFPSMNHCITVANRVMDPMVNEFGSWSDIEATCRKCVAKIWQLQLAQAPEHGERT